MLIFIQLLCLLGGQHAFFLCYTLVGFLCFVATFIITFLEVALYWLKYDHRHQSVRYFLQCIEATILPEIEEWDNNRYVQTIATGRRLAVINCKNLAKNLISTSLILLLDCCTNKN